MNNEQKAKIEVYVKDRDIAVKSMNVDTFKAFMKRYGFFTGTMTPMPTDEVVEITMRKMAVHSTSLDVDTRVEAFRWLLERGYDFSMGE